MSPGISSMIHIVLSFVYTVVQPKKKIKNQKTKKQKTNKKTKKQKNRPTRPAVKDYGFKKHAGGNAIVAKLKLCFLSSCKNLGITAFCKTSSALTGANSSRSCQQ